ncbi:MAG: phosphocholine cytidylyltransferase family protein [Proteobacteria bacterium]|nr:phosphocholine cytidylyltransferase family protein [Pseudomonadota bacterium]
MKAVLLAAGQGTRLLPLTNDRPKCMVEYRGRPIIDHILDTLSVCSVEDIVLIKGYLADVLDRPCTKSIINTRFASTNMVHTLFCAEEELTDSCIISYTDIIYGPSILKALLDCPDDISLTVDKDWKKLWEARMEDPLRDAETLRLTDDGYIIELGKKPKSYDDIEGQYMGLIKLTAKGCEQVRCHYHSLDRDAEYDGKDFDNMYMTSFIQSMIDSGIPVKAVPISGGWLEIDSLEDLNHSL